MKNKKLADRLLVILFLFFIAVTFIKAKVSSNFYIDLLAFVIEASLIGGIADWFAITALYRKPLGFSWHTAIIPRNRVKVIEAISNVVQHELLSRQTIRDKIYSINFIDRIILLIDTNLENQGYLMELTKKYTLKVLDNLEVSKIALLLEKGIKSGLLKLPFSELLNKAVLNIIDNKTYEEPLGELIDYLIIGINKDSTRQEIFNVINELINKNLDNQRGVRKTLMKLVLGVAEGTDSVNLMDAAASIQKELCGSLTGLKDTNDPNHIKIIMNVREMVQKLDSDETAIHAIEAWKLETIGSLSFEHELDKLIENLKAALITAISSPESEIQGVSLSDTDSNDNFRLYLKSVYSILKWVKLQLKSYWQNFKNNEDSKHTADSYLKEFIYRTIESNHWVIGILVKRCLDNLTDDALNAFIENKAGNDLHWIRINGCIIGAIFGLVVFLFLHIIYTPILSIYGIGL